MNQLLANQPISAALEADLREYVRRNGLSIWLDAEAHYVDFVRELQERADALPYKVFAFTGSHLELMLALDGVANGVHKGNAVIHMPGFNETSIKSTPIFEFYKAGKRYRKALDTLVGEAAAGVVKPDQIDDFKSQPDKSLAGADTWLRGHMVSDVGDAAGRLSAMSPRVVLDTLLSGQMPASVTPDAMWHALEVLLGLPPAWRTAALPGRQSSPRDIAYAAAGWAMCVEYVEDLAREPVSPLLAPATTLPKPLVEKGCQLAEYVRLHHHELYRRWADEAEGLIADEVAAARAEDLGKIDTFRFEEDKVLKAALAALERKDWVAARVWARQRLDKNTKASTRSFWLEHDPNRKSAWELVSNAADLGIAIDAAGMQLGIKSAGGGLTAAVEAYTKRGAAVDQAHRQLEQRRVKLLYPSLPEFEELRRRMDALRVAWREWADGWAKDFSAVCRADGFLPQRHEQQRAIFEDVVRPMAQESGSTTAYFVVDALRYEMGEELFSRLKETPATVVQLKARLAELPSITEIGMNALAPVEKGGRLTSSMNKDSSGLQGFHSGEYRVHDPETRQRAMYERVGGGTCPWLSLGEVVNRDSVSLKRAIAQARLLVVHSQEIDNAGENGNGPSVFEDVLQMLVAAWRLLRDAGVRRFVFTSDHGFLLLDEHSPQAQAHGRKIDPKRRHVFSQLEADHPGETRVALQDLGYEGVSGYVMFPETTAVFDTGRRSMSFVHGGNSLQERVIPVLTVVHKTAAGGDSVQYEVVATAAGGVGGMHCINASVQVSQGALGFVGAREIELAMRVSDADNVDVELCQTRGDATIRGNNVSVAVGADFELFFRLIGRTDARVMVELYHPAAVADVSPGSPDKRFEVTVSRTVVPAPAEVASAPASAPAVEQSTSWLDVFEDANERQVFAHLEAHGAATEAQVQQMMGGARQARRFALKFDELAQKANFAVRIDSVGGMKRYVREGSK
jgi:hypothetical protein